MSNNAQWFTGHDGQQEGPMDLTTLRQRIAAGQVLATDMVWREGMAGWQEAGRVPELSAGPGTPPPLPASSTVRAQPLSQMPIGYASSRPYVPSPGDLGQDTGMRMLLPVGRSGWAIAAGYLGLFSLLPIFAPFALVAALLAIRDMRKNPQRHGMGRAIFGLIMGLLGTAALVFMIVVVIADKHGF